MVGVTSPSEAKAPSLGTLRVVLTALLVLTGLFGLAMIYGVVSHRSAMKAVGKDSAPSIIAAQHIKADLADMHTNVANILLSEPGKAPTAVKGYDDARKDLSIYLVSTFEGERENAVTTLEKWLQYVAIDRQLRQLEKEGKHEAAVKLCLGRSPGESDYAFAQFNDALGKTIDVNQLAFNEIMEKKSPATLLPMWFAAPLSALAIAVLAFVGLRPAMHDLEITQK